MVRHPSPFLIVPFSGNQKVLDEALIDVSIFVNFFLTKSYFELNFNMARAKFAINAFCARWLFFSCLEGALAPPRVDLHKPCHEKFEKVLSNLLSNFKANRSNRSRVIDPARVNRQGCDGQLIYFRDLFRDSQNFRKIQKFRILFRCFNRLQVVFQTIQISFPISKIKNLPRPP